MSDKPERVDEVSKLYHELVAEAERAEFDADREATEALQKLITYFREGILSERRNDLVQLARVVADSLLITCVDEFVSVGVTEETTKAIVALVKSNKIYLSESRVFRLGRVLFRLHLLRPKLTDLSCKDHNYMVKLEIVDEFDQLRTCIEKHKKFQEARNSFRAISGALGEGNEAPKPTKARTAKSDQH